MKPCKDETIYINNDLKAVYSYWENGRPFRRQPGWWANMSPRDFKQPEKNQTLVNLHNLGVEFGTVEHVSFTVSGTAYYTYDVPTGFAEDVGIVGDHNVENGVGYLPINAFTRITMNDHVTCCVLARSNKDLDYYFDVLVDEPLPRDAVFVHYPIGNKQKTTEYDVKAGTVIQGTAIAGYLDYAS